MENPADKGVVRPAGARAEDTAPQAAQYFPVDPGDRLVPETDAHLRGPAGRGRLACPNPPSDTARLRVSIYGAGAVHRAALRRGLQV